MRVHRLAALWAVDMPPETACVSGALYGARALLPRTQLLNQHYENVHGNQHAAAAFAIQDSVSGQ
jgi:hypothetical protein